MAKKNSDSIPQQGKYLNSSGMVTNAKPGLGSPNGMEFERTAVDMYFADKNEDHWKDEDRASGQQPPIETFDPDSMADDMTDYYRKMQVENSRFMFYPVAKG